MKAFVLAAAVVCAWAGTEPKTLPADYPIHLALAHATIAAEYHGRAISQENDSHYVGQYLVVEVAFYPEKGPPMAVAGHEFRLRLNNSTRELSAQSPGLVAGALRNPGWDRYRGVQGGAGVGSGGIVIGGPRTTERFPGDPQARAPRPPRAPNERGEKPDSIDAAAKAVEKYAFEDTTTDHPWSGLLYFAWDGKVKDLKSIQLVYSGSAGKAVFRLR